MARMCASKNAGKQTSNFQKCLELRKQETKQTEWHNVSNSESNTASKKIARMWKTRQL